MEKIKYFIYKNWLSLLIIIYGFIFILPLIIHGSALFGDSNAYYALFKTIHKGSFPHSDAYVPGFPLFLYFLSIIFRQTDFSLFSVANIIFMVINIFYLINITSFFKSLFSKAFIIIFFFSEYLLQIQFMAHADALALNLLLLLILSLLVFDFNSFKSSIFSGVVCALLILVKNNYIVLFPVFIFWLFYFVKSKELLKRGVYMVIFPIFSLLFWKLANGQFIHNIGLEFNFNLFLEAIVININDLGKYFSQFYFAKLIYRVPFINVSILGILLYLSIAIFASLKLNNINSKLKPLYIFLIIFYVLYPLSLILITSKTGHIEVNSRSLFPLFLTSIFLFICFFDFYLKFHFFKISLCIYLIVVLKLNISFLFNTIKQPYYTSVNKVLFINEKYKSVFLELNKVNNIVFYTDEENDSRFYIPNDLILFPNAKRYPKVGKRDYFLNYNVKDSLLIIDNLNKKSVCFLYHRNNTKDTLFKKNIIERGAKKIINEPGCEIYLLKNNSKYD